jgi:hypothetical protein
LVFIINGLFIVGNVGCFGGGREIGFAPAAFDDSVVAALTRRTRARAHLLRARAVSA